MVKWDLVKAKFKKEQEDKEKAEARLRKIEKRLDKIESPNAERVKWTRTG